MRERSLAAVTTCRTSLRGTATNLVIIVVVTVVIVVPERDRGAPVDVVGILGFLKTLETLTGDKEVVIEMVDGRSDSVLCTDGLTH